MKKLAFSHHGYLTPNYGPRGLALCVCVCVCVLSHSVVSNSAMPSTVAHQVLLSMEFSRQEYWSESHIKDSNQSLSDSALETSSSSPHSIAQGHLKY